MSRCPVTQPARHRKPIVCCWPSAPSIQSYERHEQRFLVAVTLGETLSLLAPDFLDETSGPGDSGLLSASMTATS